MKKRAVAAVGPASVGSSPTLSRKRLEGGAMERALATPPNAVDSTIAFLDILGRLKDTPRTGWVERHVWQPESVADHMYRMSVFCLLCPDPTLDRTRMMKVALCHDMAEALVGDISPAMNVSKEVKHRLELEAITKMCSMLGRSKELRSIADEILSCWNEYEEQKTKESHYVRDMDLLEMVHQAHIYEDAETALPPGTLSCFFTAVGKLRHPFPKAIGEKLIAMRDNRHVAHAAAATATKSAPPLPSPPSDVKRANAKKAPSRAAKKNAPKPRSVSSKNGKRKL
jgi:putative hydrolase of HD superfamily